MTKPSHAERVAFEARRLRRAVLLALAGAIPLGLAVCTDPKPGMTTEPGSSSETTAPTTSPAATEDARVATRRPRSATGSRSRAPRRRYGSDRPARPRATPGFHTTRYFGPTTARDPA